MKFFVVRLCKILELFFDDYILNFFTQKVILAIVGSIAALPQFPEVVQQSFARHHGGSQNYPNIKLLEYEFENFEDGGYHFRYVQDDGQRREETGTLVIEDEIDEHGHVKLDEHGNPEKGQWISVKGSYSYVDIDDGSILEVTYTGDKNGFRQKSVRRSNHHGSNQHDDGAAGGGGFPIPVALPALPGLGGGSRF